MKVVYLGGANEVGASSILLNLCNKNILLDCGIRQNKNKDRLPDFSILEQLHGIDAIVVSHAHMDHIGALPIISKEYPNAPIYMTGMTLDLARVLLYDSLKIMNYNEGEIPMFSEEDVLNMLNRVVVVPFQKEIKIQEDIQLEFYMAGHIGGAACAYLKTKEGTVFYTGDFSLTNAHTINGMSIPRLRPDVVISETTYGDKLHSNRQAEEIRLVKKVSEILENQGKVLIPVFALGRSQEVILILKKEVAKQQLSNVPIYVDGMVQNINTVFENNPLYLKPSLGKKILREKHIFYDEHVQKVTDDEMRKKIVEDATPCIVVASSGMLIGGRSEYYASYMVEEEKNGIILTGYQDEESNGRLLLNLLEEEKTKRKLKLQGQVHSVKCDIDMVGLSAHADKQEIKNVLSMLHPRSIILGHGDKKTIESFAKEITTEFNCAIYAPDILEVLDIKIKNPRKQIDKKLEYLFSENGDMKAFYTFIKDHYANKLFTKEDLAYIYYGKEPREEDIMTFTKMLMDSIYFTQDNHRYFLFKICEETEIENSLNKEITNQELEEKLISMIQDYPYKKISFYRPEKRIVVTFDFPRTVDSNFYALCTKFYEETGFQVERNDNVNNFACEAVIKEMLGMDNVDKISYLPMEDKFRVKVFDSNVDTEEIKKKIGYEVELVLTPKKEIKANRVFHKEKMDQNTVIHYIDAFFQEKKNKPYKISLKNGMIVLSFVTYEIGLRYLEDINTLKDAIGYEITLNRNANMVEVFNRLNMLLNNLGITKVKNPSFLPSENKVSVKVEMCDEEKLKKLKDLFFDEVGLELIINT